MTKNPADKILPCPFCGSDNLKTIYGYFTWIVCDDCNARGPIFAPRKVKEDLSEAIKAWNRAKR